MPNWAYGIVNVRGKPKDVENFCKLFVYSENKPVGEKYFARSFAQEGKWEDFKKEIKGSGDVELHVEFAWSCWSCLFEGYPNGEECVTLEWAMRKYNVEVEIETEEEGMCFEENVITENGLPVHSSKDMPVYTCQNCGNKQSFPSDLSKYEIQERTCYECNKEYVWFDELAELIENKIK